MVVFPHIYEQKIWRELYSINLQDGKITYGNKNQLDLLLNNNKIYNL